MDRLEDLHAENERLRQIINDLEQHIAALLAKLGQQGEVPPLQEAHPASTKLPERISVLLRHLPTTFTVDHLIDVSEELNVNVFVAYRDLKAFIELGLLEETDGAFEQTELCRYLIERLPEPDAPAPSSRNRPTSSASSDIP